MAPICPSSQFGGRLQIISVMLWGSRDRGPFRVESGPSAWHGNASCPLVYCRWTNPRSSPNCDARGRDLRCPLHVNSSRSQLDRLKAVASMVAEPTRRSAQLASVTMRTEIPEMLTSPSQRSPRPNRSCLSIHSGATTQPIHPVRAASISASERPARRSWPAMRVSSLFREPSGSPRRRSPPVHSVPDCCRR